MKTKKSCDNRKAEIIGYYKLKQDLQAVILGMKRSAKYSNLTDDDIADDIQSVANSILNVTLITI